MLFTVVIAVLLLSSVAHADCPSGSGLCNPLAREYSSIPTFIQGALKALVVIALPIITFFFVYSGFMFVMARGNEAQLTKARKNFLYVVIGAVLILGAWILSQLIAGTVSQLTNIQ